MKFHCKNCSDIFEAEGIRREFTSPVYGQCFQFYSYCPVCEQESEEYAPMPVAASAPSDEPACGMGGCCGCKA